MNKRSESLRKPFMFFSRGSKKRGISAIVATVLVILITVAAIAIIWVAILPMIRENLDAPEIDTRLTIVTSGGYTTYDASKNLALVQVKRNAGDAEMKNIEIIFKIDGNSYKTTVPAPTLNNMRTYTFNFSGYPAPESVGVAPLFIVGETEESGTVSSEIKVTSGTIADAPAEDTWYQIGDDYSGGGPGDVSCEGEETRECGTDVGECVSGTQTCSDGTYGSCVGEVISVPEVFGEATCSDGLDNDCDGVNDTDDSDCAACTDGVPGVCSLTMGVCAGVQDTCVGGVWQGCDYGDNYEATEDTCDGVADNDCDGDADASDSDCLGPGDGTSGNPFKVKVCRGLDGGLENVGDGVDGRTLSAYYELVNDIDCSASVAWDGGNGFDPIGGAFTGNFNGNGYSIIDLAINRASLSKVGLFASNQGTIKNVALINPSIYGQTYVGGFAGYMDLGVVTQVYVSGGTIKASRHQAGGIVGHLGSGATISNSYNTDLVVKGTNANYEYRGGVVGRSFGTISNSYSFADVSIGSYYLGGLVGMQGTSGKIYNSFAGGDVSGISNVGSLIGSNSGGGIYNSYFYNQSGNPSVCIANGAGSCGLQSDIAYFYDDQNDPFYGNWDSSIWEMDGSSLPILKWQL